MEDEVVYNGWLKVCKRKVNDRIYDVLKDYDAVSAVIVNEYDEILLVKQFRPALMEESLEIFIREICKALFKNKNIKGVITHVCKSKLCRRSGSS